MLILRGPSKGPCMFLGYDFDYTLKTKIDDSSDHSWLLYSASLANSQKHDILSELHSLEEIQHARFCPLVHVHLLSCSCLCSLSLLCVCSV